MDMDEKKIRQQLSACKLFAGVEGEDIRWLFTKKGITQRRVKKDEIIAFRGDVYDRLIIILSGGLTAEFHDYSGKVLKVETLKQAEAAATAILFAEDNVLPVTLTAETDSTLLEIRKSLVFTFMQRSRVFLENIIGDMGMRLSLLADKIFTLQFNTIRQKIAAYVLDLSSKQSTESPRLLLTKEKLAEVFGVTRPALSRCFSEMTADGLLAQEGKCIHIMDREALRGVLEDE